MDKYIITGVSGFIGRHLLNTLSNSRTLGIYHHNPPPVRQSRSRIFTRYDLTQQITDQVLMDDDSPVVIHAAAYAHINKCELERKLGPKSLPWLGNVVATQNLIDFCKMFNKKLVLLSTECVYSGEKIEYIETDAKRPRSWYGYTKSIAEDLVATSGVDYLIVRGVVAYGQGGLGSNVLQGMVNNLVYMGKTQAVTDQQVSFTYVDDFTQGVVALIKKHQSGIFHIAGSQIATPYEFALKICKRLRLPSTRVKGVSMIDFFGKEKAKLRLKNSVLNSKKFIEATGRKSLSLDEGVERIFLR